MSAAPRHGRHRAVAPDESALPPRAASGAAGRRWVWRTVGVLGEVLVTLGVLVVLFLVWQLFWTDIIADHHQAQIVAQVQHEWGPPAQAPPDVPLTKHHGDPPPEPSPEAGEVWALMYVPRFGKDYVRPVAEGVDKETVLDKIGVGHYSETQMPGQLGNFALAGHRTTFGKPFAQIAEIEKGDAIVVRTKATWYVYRATDHLVVWPGQVGVLSPVPTDNWTFDAQSDGLTKRYLTMTSCHPKVWGVHRYIQHAVFAYWAPVSEGVPKELDGMQLTTQEEQGEPAAASMVGRQTPSLSKEV